MARGFGIRPALRGSAGGLVEIGDRALGEAGLAQVMCENLRPRRGRIGEPATFERARDAAVQLLTPRAQQALVSSVLDERVLEDVRRVRRRTPAED